jgi:O-antigen/teichoic acid export membrane protein
MNNSNEGGRIVVEKTPHSRPNMLAGKLARLKHLVGLDRAIAWTLAGRFWSMGAGVATVLLIARFLSPAEQGYYYTFASLVALQVFFELGFAYVVLQMASHERTALTISEDGLVLGDPVSQSRLASILKTSLRWYSAMAAIMAITLLPAGLYFFQRGERFDSVTGWQAPWCILALAASFNLLVDPVFSFLEGCGLVSKVAHMRFGQAIVGSSLGWIALLTHHGLFAPPMILLGQIAWGTSWLFRRRRLLRYLLRVDTAEHSVSWRREIFPFQWRIAVSWLGGYFVFQLFNPVLFAYQGPVAAGRMGMSLTVMGALSTVALAWINTKSSPFGALVAQREFQQLDRLFFRTLRQSTLLLAGCCAVVFCGLLLCAHYAPRLAARVLTPWAFGLLLLTAVMNHVLFSQAIYLRAHKAEPFLVAGVCAAIVMACSTYVMGRFLGVNAVAAGFFVVTLVTTPITTYIFLTKRTLWHSDR